MIESSKAYHEAIVGDPRRMYVKAVVNIIDPDIVEGEVARSGEDPELSWAEQVWDKKFSLTANYAGMEPNRWALDGSRVPLPEPQPDWEAGLVGAELSGPNGMFSVPQFVEINFSNVSILQACSIAFSDDPVDGVGADFTVEVFSQGVAYVTRTITGNTQAVAPITAFRVYDPDRIRVTITRWSLPGRRMRVAEVVPGVYEVWDGDMIEELSVKHQGDVSCLTLPYGTATIKMDNQSRRFEPRNKDGVFLSIEERQGIELYMGPQLPDGTIEYKPLGVFYQAANGWKTGDNSITMKWDLVDIIGLLSQRQYKPVAHASTLAGWLGALTSQLGKNFANRFHVDPAYADKPVSGPVEGMTCGEILRYVCMATGTWPRADAETGKLTAEPLWHDGAKVTLDNLNRYPVMSANRDVALITVNGRSTIGNSPSAGETINVENPFLGGAAKYAEAARLILDTCGGHKLEITGRGNPASEIGDIDRVWLEQGNAVSARRIRQELALRNGVLVNCASVLLQSSGILSYTNRRQFIGGGTFIVPDGVYELRVVLVDKGSNGGAGTDGDWRGLPGYGGFEVGNGGGISPGRAPGSGEYIPGRGPMPLIGPDGNEIFTPDIVYGAGEDGAPGAGGLIAELIVNVNPGQAVSVGSSSFGSHTLGNSGGRHYDGGWVDVATGEVYGRDGCGGPPGSGNGGYPGKAGEIGEVHGVMAMDHAQTGREWWVVDKFPTKGSPGGEGASGCVIVYWEDPDEGDEEV